MRIKPKLFLALAAAALFQGRSWSAEVTVVNDGTAITNLVKLSNASETGDAVARLTANSGLLAADQTGFVGNIPLRTTWHLADLAATNGVYSVAGDFKPAEPEIRNRGGVMGWLDLATKQGITLQVIPAGEPAVLQVAVVDFNATDADANENFGRLFNLDGSPATDSLTSARSALDNYSPTKFATVQLEFAAPTEADRQLTNLTATARLRAKLFQLDASSAAIQLGRTVELLTDLPLPAGFNHRAGYFAYLASVFVDGPIGQLDNLSLGGGFVPVPNTPPTVRITSPAGGAVFPVAPSIPIEATANDADGAITQVKFLADGTLIGQAGESPYTITWSNVPSGAHSLTAQAVDNRGATATSVPVNITVNSNSLPAVALTSPVNGATFPAPATLTIEAGASDNDGAVTRVEFFANGASIGSSESSPYSVTWSEVPAGIYRLTAKATDDLGASVTSAAVAITIGTPTIAPTITIKRTLGTVELAWEPELTGFVLETAPSLGSQNWQTVTGSASTNRVALSAAATSAFFRLVRGAETPAPPTLAIRRSGTSVEVSWASGVSGFVLQTTTNLAGAAWTDLSAAGNSATVAIAGGAQYFRLRKP